jgi:hypothetical protein
MKRWLPLFSTILAVGVAAVAAHAQIPHFVRPGLVVIYQGNIGTPQDSDSFPQGLTTSTQKITVTSVTSDPVGGSITSVSGTTELTNFLVPPTDPLGTTSVHVGSKTVGWTCNVNQPCAIDPSQLGAIAQFWVNPTNSLGSIFTPEGDSYNPYMNPNPTNVSPPPPKLAMTCPDTIGTCIVYDMLVPPQGARTPVNVCKECLILAFDTTGLVKYSVEWRQPSATLAGAVGELVYKLQSLFEPPWQSDGSSIFLQDAAGNIVISQLNGTSVIGGGTLTTPGPIWHVQGYADFNGDGKLDILWQSDSGQVVIWLTNETSYITGGVVGTVDPSWHIKGTGDFNKDGKSDILLQNDNGDVVIWFIDGTGYVGGVYVGYAGGYHVVGTGDFDVDGKSDILFQNDDGDVVIWEVDGRGYIGGGYVGYAGNYHALGTGDFYGNGLSDILFQNDNGDVVIWEINGTRYVGGGYVNMAPGWRIIGVGDYNGDHRSDILFQNSSGDVVIWEMNGIQIVGGGSITK